MKVGLNDPLSIAISQIDRNHLGIVFVVDDSGVVCGCLTDGDIRRWLIKTGSIDGNVHDCYTADFISVREDCDREALLKLFDQRAKVIPVLDACSLLKDIVTRDEIPFFLQRPVYTRARSPVRISFGGGGSDLTYFFTNHKGAVINAAISLYSHAVLRIREDDSIFIYSSDLRESLESKNLADLLVRPGSFGLVQAVLRAVRPDHGFELYLYSDFPIKSGLGGSASVAAAILGCFNELRQDKWSAYELAELTYQAERIHLGIEGGWQDQYATVFGGVNFLEFQFERNIVHPLRVHPDTLAELEESLVLCDTGTTHESGDIHRDQRGNTQKGRVQEFVKANVTLTYRIRDCLLRGRLSDFGEALHQAWELKKNFSEGITNHRLDELYRQALAHGALGGKLLGAGGGGFFLFYVTSFRRHELVAYLVNQGLTIRPFRLEQEGLKSWKMREQRPPNKRIVQ